MKKVGIITIDGGANYGNCLQNLAMTQVLKKLNALPSTIGKMHYSDGKFKTAIKDCVKMGMNIIPISYIKRNRKFEKFRYQYIEFATKKANNSDLNKDFDLFICGSDQIWNFDLSIIRRYKELYFANFADHKKRFAYSASIGTSDIPEEYNEFFISSIKNMNKISVREYEASKIIKEKCGIEAPVTIDPTLILTADEWKMFERIPENINEKFLLTYFLGNVSEELQTFISEVAKDNGLIVINLYNDVISRNKVLNKEHYSYDPGEFLWLIDNCEVLLTDSFHGCVFSILFKKSFRWFSRNQKNQLNMNSRMDTLFKITGLGEWCIGNMNDKNVFDCDFTNVFENIEKEKNISLDYLRDVVENNGNN